VKSRFYSIFLKGIAMGAADAVPGVSGGTIAFISGIYQELIDTISGINLSLIRTWRKEGFKAFWHQLNGNFLIALFLGILTSFVSLMRVAKYLIEQEPIMIWSFFFGLILASVWYIGKQIETWNIRRVIALVIGGLLAYYISVMPGLSGLGGLWFLPVAGALAICAMILPGISGSFILVILGAYKVLSDAMHDLDVKRIMLFGLGAVIGLLSFSRALKWLFHHYAQTTLAVLTGFVLGSLNKIWPWKQTWTVMQVSDGTIYPMTEQFNLGTLSLAQKQQNDFKTLKSVIETSISPGEYATINAGADPQLWMGIGLMALGFLTLFVLERVAQKDRN